METLENGPYVLIKVGLRGIESVTLGEQSESEEAHSLDLYTKFHHVIREIDKIISQSPGRS
jgi:hypothetical protein